MAKMIPQAASTESEAEKKVFEALRRGLDNTYTVFHSLDVLAKNREGRLIDAEIDFLVFSPCRGILVLEVKGGRIRFDAESGTWLQNRRPLKQSPFRQARLNKYDIKKYLAKRLGSRLDVPMGHAVCFPDVPGGMPDLPPEASDKIIITAPQLPHIDKAVESIMAGFMKQWAKPLRGSDASAVKRALMPVFEYGMSLVDRLGKAKRKILTLTREQCELLDFLGDRRRVLVRGCVGSGKTVLAMKKAVELASEGKKVLLLCYNQPLSRYLAQSVAATKHAGNITAKTYHAFCTTMLEEAGHDVEFRKGDREFWETELPDRFARLLSDHPVRYDAVIVDEGQDFKVNYWGTIEEMIGKDGYFYIFYDPQQNLFDTEMQFPISDEPFVLRTNCRNSRKIGSEVMKYTNEEIRIRDDAPDGEPVMEKRCPTDAERRKELGNILRRLVKKEKISEHRIVVLGGHAINHTCLGDDHRVGGFAIEREAERAPGVIPYYSYMRFKGCEADAVILIDVDPGDRRWSSPRSLYTAISRAKFLVYILYK